MSLERKEADLKKIDEAIKLLKGPASIKAIQQSILMMFETARERMIEDIAVDRGG